VSVRIDDWGVRRLDASNEAIAWADLVKVEIVTTDEGPWSEDLFFLLEGVDGKGVAIAGGLAQDCGLIAALQQRLPDIDNDAIIQGASSTENARFLVWRKRNV
jgi:hypothetical protein